VLNHVHLPQKEAAMESPQKGRGVLYLILFLVAVILAVYVWKVFAVRSVRGEMDAQRVELVDASRRALTVQTAEMLRLAAIPLAWAVRAEAIQENYEQIHDYFARFVKERFVTGIALVGADGTVRAATDKKLEGQPATGVFDPSLLHVQDVVVSDSGEGDIRVAIPILGYQARLGTLILSYSRDAIAERVPTPASGTAGAPSH
jgi:hypothetical protein